MSISQAIAGSIEIWRERLARLTAAVAGSDDDAWWWRSLDESVLGRGASAARAALGRARPESQSLQFVRSAMTSTPVTRLQFAGVTAVVAAVVHLLLMWPRGTIGLWWLILPALAFGFGVIAIGTSMGSSRR